MNTTVCLLALFTALMLWAQIARWLSARNWRNGARDASCHKWLEWNGRIVGSVSLRSVGLWLTPRLSVSFCWDAFSPWMLSYPVRLPRQWFAGLFRPANNQGTPARGKWIVLPRDGYACCPWIVRLPAVGVEVSRYYPGHGFSKEYAPAGLLFSRTKFNRVTA